MTYAEREEMFAKDYLTIQDIQNLLGVSYQDASARMGAIRATVGDRLGIKGKIHVQDYLDFYKIPSSERYSRVLKSDSEDNRL